MHWGLISFDEEKFTTQTSLGMWKEAGFNNSYLAGYLHEDMQA